MIGVNTVGWLICIGLVIFYENAGTGHCKAGANFLMQSRPEMGIANADMCGNYSNSPLILAGRSDFQSLVANCAVGQNIDTLRVYFLTPYNVEVSGNYESKYAKLQSEILENRSLIKKQKINRKA